MADLVVGRIAFTPGPWRFDGDDRVLSERLCVALVTSGVDDLPELDRGPAYQANARLIAASPDLLEACRAVLCSVTDDPPFSVYYDRLKKAVQDVRAAIAKAEGLDRERGL